MTVNAFRKRRGRVLAKLIADLAGFLGRKIEVLDVGGRAEYWSNIDVSNIAKITLLNNEAHELVREVPQHLSEVELESVHGNALDLSEYGDRSVELVHSNSVIEHVGSWVDMSVMANETKRVGLAGWIQTPAFEFPIEPHFRAPFLHWFGQPLRRKLMYFSPHYRKLDVWQRRYHIDRINLLSGREMRALFSDRSIYVERMLFPKSYVAHWGPLADAPQLIQIPVEGS